MVRLLPPLLRRLNDSPAGVPQLWYACIYVELCRFPYPSLQLQSFSECDILLLLDMKEGKENAEASDR